VALARAAAFEPRFLLMDEPLSNLDAALRVETRQRVRALQRELRATTIYVTHDQEEALAQSDRLGLMEGGRLLQVGSPEELYQRPESRFAASFLGRCNLFAATPGAGGESIRVAGIGEFAAPPRSASVSSDGAGALLLVRPEQFHVVCASDDLSRMPRLRGRLENEEYLGEKRLLRVASDALPGGLVEVALRGREASRCPAPIGGEVAFEFDPAECWLLPGE
jgi:ABC-type Fe3+/spermidine/putrescine transport system ATPase subunit